MGLVQEVRTVEVVAAEIRALTASMLSNVIEIGRRMCEAKEMLPHGAFGTWIEENTGYSRSTATNFMRLFQEYGAEQGCLFGAEVKCQTIGNLGYSKALALLALPAEERESFAEHRHMVGGREKTVEEMSNKELQQAIRAKKEAEERADRLAAELATQRAEAEDRLGTATGELEQLQRELEQSRAAAADRADRLAEAEQAAEELRKELEERKAAPVEVAVEVDREAVDRARAEAVAEMQAKVDRAREQAEQAKEKQREAEEKQREAARKLAAAHARLEETARAEQAGAMAEDKELAVFELLFSQGQELANKLHGILTKVKDRENPVRAEQMSRAMTALADAIRKAAEL